MSRKGDLEQSIRESYNIIRESEAIIRISDRPDEKVRAQRVIQEQWANIERYLGEYRRLVHPFPSGIAEIATHFPAKAKMSRIRLGDKQQAPHGRLGVASVIVDESYRQGEWSCRPTASAGYSIVIEDLCKVVDVFLNRDGYTSKGILPANGILILPTPYGTMVDEAEFEEISKWVHQGGSLLVLGIYLMETHHYNNLNRLVRRFGFEFAHNLTMPRGKESFSDCMHQAFACREREFWIVCYPHSDPESHPLLKGISAFALTSSCTIECAAKPDLTVITSDPVAILHARGYRNPSGRLLQITDYVVDRYASAPFMIALRHGKGKVVGIGTWKVFLNELVTSYPSGNRKLFENIIDWLAIM